MDFSIPLNNSVSFPIFFGGDADEHLVALAISASFHGSVAVRLVRFVAGNSRSGMCKEHLAAWRSFWICEHLQ